NLIFRGRPGEASPELGTKFAVRIERSLGPVRQLFRPVLRLVPCPPPEVGSVMNLASLLLTSLYVLTAVAFIGVLNARGVWRTAVAAALALGCLGAALWHTTAWRAERMVTGQNASQGLGGEGVVSGRFDAGDAAPDGV